MVTLLTRERIDQLRAEIMQGLPGRDEHFYNYGVAMRVWEHFLGHDWLKANLLGAVHAPYFRVAGVPEHPLSGVVREHRVVRGCMALYRVQGVDGMDAMIVELKKRDLAGAIAEVQAAEGLLEAGHSVSFITRQNRKRADYDALANVRGVPVAVEVKCADEARTDDIERWVKNRINRARKQMPDMAGLLVLRIPESWATFPSTVARIDATAKRELGGTGRIVAVVLVSHILHFQGDDPSKGPWAIGDWFFTIPNGRARYRVPDVLNIWAPTQLRVFRI